MHAARSQSAMEYLMTYGWAILIIAVVLAVLFQLGVFSGGNFLPHAQAGSCQVSRTVAGVSLEGQCNGMLPEFVGVFTQTVTTNVLINESFAGGSSPMTFTFWFYPSDLSGALVSFVKTTYGCGPPPNGYEVAISSTGTLYAGAVCNDDVLISSSADWSAGKWGFVAVTYTDSSVNEYVWYGGQFYTNSGSVTVSTAPNPNVFIGGDWGTGLNGYIANVQLYNTSLSQSEIQALYLEGIGGAPIRPQNIIGWWPLNGNANDYSGNSNNGQLNGVTFSSSWASGYTAP